jgi:peptide-methionine (S)-S-oxide reductase
MRQGNDVGTQYRSGIYALNEAQLAAALASRDRFQSVLTAARFDEITTEIASLDSLNANWFYAEGYHQQYLSKNPGGYCGLGSTGMSCPIGVAKESD